MSELSDMVYPGRVVIVGKSPLGDDVVLYAITGRSESSQARRLEQRGSQIVVKPTDEDVLKQGNVDLLVYPAIDFSNHLAVSNGKQTTSVVEALKTESAPYRIFDLAHREWSYEPDEPNFTPRISGCIVKGVTNAGLAIISKGEGDLASKRCFDFALDDGQGRLIATYTGVNENPLPSFEGDPIKVPIVWKDAGEAVTEFYDMLSPNEGCPDFRVSVAGVFKYNARTSVAIKNRHDLPAIYLNNQ